MTLEQRYKLEIATVHVLILAAIWTRRTVRTPVVVALVLILLITSVIDRPGWRESGLSLRKIADGWKFLLLLPPLVIAIWAIGILWGTASPQDIPGLFPKRTLDYMYGAWLQQLVLQSYLFVRLDRLRPQGAVLLSAAGFFLWHLPNPVLAPITFLGGLATSALFKKYRNFYMVAAAHGILGVAIASYWPHWTMVAGRGYWLRHAWPAIRQCFGC